MKLNVQFRLIWIKKKQKKLDNRYGNDISHHVSVHYLNHTYFKCGCIYYEILCILCLRPANLLY